MKSAEIKHLRERWSEEDILRINQVLKLGRISAKDVAIIDIAGKEYVDLRGFHIKEVIKEVELAYVDFSYGMRSSGGQLGLCKIDHCIFVGGDFGTNLSKLLTNCDFEQAKMQRAALYGDFCNCNFAKANLSNCRGYGKFIECSFEGANLKGAHFIECFFDRCVFKNCKFGNGSLAKSTFIGFNQDGVDFKNTLLEGTEIK